MVPATSEAELYRKQVAELEQMLLGANEVARSRYDQLQVVLFHDQNSVPHTNDFFTSFFLYLFLSLSLILQKDFERAKEELTRLNQAPAAPPPAKLKKLEEKIREQQDTIEMKDKVMKTKGDEICFAFSRHMAAWRNSSPRGVFCSRAAIPRAAAEV